MLIPGYSGLWSRLGIYYKDSLEGWSAEGDDGQGEEERQSHNDHPILFIDN